MKKAKSLILTLAAALGIVAAPKAQAATPVVVWDGGDAEHNFSHLSLTGDNGCTYTIANGTVGGGNSFYRVTTAADASKGVWVTATGTNPFGATGHQTVIMKCSGINITGANKLLIGINDGAGKSMVGMNRVNDNNAKTLQYIADGNSNQGGSAVGVLTTDPCTVAFTYDSSAGSAIYVDGVLRSSDSSIKYSSFTTPSSVSLGGVKEGTYTGKFHCMNGMYIYAVAIFDQTLTPSEVAGYQFPSEVPVAEWKGDFTATQTGYTLELNGNALADENASIEIGNDSDNYTGVDIDFAEAMNGMTVIVRYENLVKGEQAKMLMESCIGNDHNGRTGIDLQATDTLRGAWWNTSSWADNGDNNTPIASSGFMAFTYKGDSGTYLYHSSQPGEAFTQKWGSTGLKSSDDTSLTGVTIGGMRDVNKNTDWRAAQGMKITGIAVFKGVVSKAGLAAYLLNAYGENPTPDFSYTASNNTTAGWFTSWGGETFAATAQQLGPTGSMAYRTTGDQHPWVNYTAGRSVSLALYADISDVVNNNSQKRVLAELGGNTGMKAAIYREGAYVKAAYFNGGTLQGSAASLPVPEGSGYHLYTMTCDTQTGAIALYVDTQSANGYKGSELTLATGFQVGSVHGGLPTGMYRGENMAVVNILGFNSVLSANQVAALAEAYPVVTTASYGSTVNYDVANGNFIVKNATPSSSSLYFGASQGTVTIPAGSVVNAPQARFLNRNNTGDRITFNLQGTLNVTSTSGNKNVWAENSSYKGILFGHYHGQGTYNITGSLIGRNAYLEAVYTAENQTINVKGGGILAVKGIWANGSHGPAVINLTENATIEVREIFSDGLAITKNFGYGTFKVTADATETRAINFNATSAAQPTTLDANGHTLTMNAAALTGSGYIRPYSATADSKVVFNGSASGFTGKILLSGDANTIDLSRCAGTFYGEVLTAAGDTYDFGTLRLAAANSPVLGAANAGTVEFTLTAEETAAKYAQLIRCSELNGTVVVTDSNRVEIDPRWVVVRDGILTYDASANYSATVTENTNWADITWTHDRNQTTATTAELSDMASVRLTLANGAVVTLPAEVINLVEVDLAGTGTLVFAEATRFAGYLDTAEGANITFDVSGFIRSLASYAVDGLPVSHSFAAFTDGLSGVTVSESTNALSNAYTADYALNSPGFTVTAGASIVGHAISFNVDSAADKAMSTTAKIGTVGISGALWDSAVGANGTISVIHQVNSEGVKTVVDGAAITIAGSRGTWSATSLDYTSNILYGYIDDDSSNTSPSLTVTGIPYEKYRVIVYHSTDTEKARFGYDTINGVNYTSANLDRAETGSFPTIKGTDNWGNAGGANNALALCEGVNYLVSDVITGASQVTVTAHRLNDPTAFKNGISRAGLAAIQIVEVGVYNEGTVDYEATVMGNVTWSTKAGLSNASGVWANGLANTITLATTASETVQTITFDENIVASSFKVTGGGNIAFTVANDATVAVGAIDLSEFTGTLNIIESNALVYSSVTNLTIAPTADMTYSSALAVSAEQTLKFAPAAGVTLAVTGQVSGSGTISVEGPGTNTFSNIAQGTAIAVNGGTVIPVTRNLYGNFTVNSGAVFDLRGQIDGLEVFTLNGGSLVNSGNEVGNNKVTLTTPFTLTADSEIGGTGNFGLIALSYAEFALALNGHTLTKTGDDTVYLSNCADASAGGTLAVNAGTVQVTGNAYLTNDNLTVAGTVSINSDRTLAVSNATVVAGGTVSGSGTLAVSGLLDLSAGGTLSSAVSLAGTTPSVKLPAGATFPYAITTGSATLANDATLTVLDSTETVLEDYTLFNGVIMPPVAMIGETPYYSINGALTAAGEADESMTVEWVFATGETVASIPENVTLDISSLSGTLDFSGVRDFSKVTFPATPSAVTITLSQTKAEIGEGVTTVTGATAGAVFAAGGATATATGTTAAINTGVKICGDATSFDVTFTNVTAYAYKEVSGATIQNDKVNGSTSGTFNNELNDTTTGIYLKHHPFIRGITDWFRNTDEITLAVVGTMSVSNRTTFIHMGSDGGDHEAATGDNAYGILIATGDKKDEVIVAWNDATTVHEICRMSVPNAATERHSYIVTKQDTGTGEDKTTTLTVYLDGVKWKTVVPDTYFMVVGGFQVGSDFGGLIYALPVDNESHYFNVSGDEGVINVLRAYDRVISPAEIAEYARVYPYVSPNGSSERSLDGTAANWVEAVDSTAWTNTDTNGVVTTTYQPAVDSSVTLTASASTTITVDLERNTTYEALTVNGAPDATVTFATSEDTGDAEITGLMTINVPVVAKYGALDLSRAVITVTEGGSLTVDYSAYDASGVYETNVVQVTGDIDEQPEGKFTFVPPTTPGRTYRCAYDAGSRAYWMTITPDHAAGDNVWIKSGDTYTADGQTVYLDSACTQEVSTVVYPGDILNVLSGATFAGTGTAAGGVIFADGSTFRVDTATTETAFVGGAVVVAEGATVTVTLGEGVALSTRKILGWGSAPDGKFAFSPETGIKASKWGLRKKNDGLYIYKVPLQILVR